MVSVYLDPHEIPMTAKSKAKFSSRISAAVHETARGLHRIGLIDKKTMRAFEATCLTTIAPLKGASECKDGRHRQ